jgi:O-ureido-D-serine cyclo-ligase
MSVLALTTSLTDLPNDDDMPFLVAACDALGLATEVCAWDDPAVDWSRYRHVVLRSTWDLTKRRAEFLDWCERVSAVTNLVNPASVARWATDKHYLADLAERGLPVVPSRFVEPGAEPGPAVRAFLDLHPRAAEFVVKPTVGSYSDNVRRFARAREAEAAEHVGRLLGRGLGAILQPYLPSIDTHGETDLVFFDGAYSHAIRKSALLMADGTVNGPTNDFRAARVPDEEERAVAAAVLEAAAAHLGLDRPLLYGRVDLVRDDAGRPRLLELDICEPSLSLRFAEGGAMRFARALARLPGVEGVPDRAAPRSQGHPAA